MGVGSCVLEHAVDDVAASLCEADAGCVAAFCLRCVCVGSRRGFRGRGTRTINAVCNRVFLRRLLPLCAGCSPRILVPLRLVMGAMPAYAARCAALLNRGCGEKWDCLDPGLEL